MDNSVIDLIVSKKAFNEVAKLDTDLQGLYKTMLDNYELSQKMSKLKYVAGDKGMANAAKGVAKLDEAQRNLLNNLDKLSVAEKNVAQQAVKASQAQSVQEKATQKLNRQKERKLILETKEGQESVKLQKQNAAQSREIRRLDSFYGRISQKLIKTTAEYKELSVRKSIFNNLTDKEIRRMQLLEGRIDKYRGALKKADERAGQFGRNVGNYKSGFDGLGFSVAQLSREMPAFANSMQTGFMAISNNIPMLVDEINTLKLANKELAASGKPTKSILKSIGAAMFSWHTLISVGVTLLTVYGADLVEMAGNLFKSRDAVSLAREAQEKYNEAMMQTVNTAMTEISTVKALIKIVSDETVEREKRNDAVAILQQKYPRYLKNLSTENASTVEMAKNIQALTKGLLQKAKFQAVENVMTEKYKELVEEQVEAMEDFNDTQTDNLKQGKEKTDQDKATISNSQKIQKIRRKDLSFLDEESGKRKDLNTVLKEARKNLDSIANTKESKMLNQLESDVIKENTKETSDQIKVLEEFMNKIIEQAGDIEDIFGDINIGSSADKQKDQLNDLFELQKYFLERNAEMYERDFENQENTIQDKLYALEQSYGAQLALSNLMRDEELKDTELTENAKILIRQRYADKSYDLEQDFLSKKAELFADEEMTLEERIKGYNDRLAKSYDEDLAELNNSYLKGKISHEDYEREKLRITEDYARQRLMTEIDALDKILKNEDLTAEEKEEFERRLAKKRKDLSEERVDQHQKTVETENDLERQKLRLYKDIGNELGAITNQLFQARIQRLDEEVQRNNDKYAVILDNERLTEQQRSAIEAERDAKNAELEKKKREQQRKQAILNKAVAFANVGINTAEAITRVMPNPVLVALTAALGAAQAATILATPIPQYKHGKSEQDNYEGIALLNDGGRQEVLYNPNTGHVEVLQGRNILRHVQSDDIVFPSVPDATAAIPQFTANDTAPREQSFKIDTRGLRKEINQGVKDGLKSARLSPTIIINNNDRRQARLDRM